MKSDSTIRRELHRVEAELEQSTNEADRQALYGAAQALAWALGQDAMAASLAFARVRRWAESA